MKEAIVLLALGLFFTACGGNAPEQSSTAGAKPKSMVADTPEDDGTGYGKIKHVDLNDPLDPAMVEAGKGIYEMKCAACHKLTEQRVVGPGWKGITERRKPEWIMNMTIDPDAMLEKDPIARDLLKQCLVRMPNQNLSEKDARDVLEFMYFNDGKPVAEK
ncbi:MAG: cytochrome c [Bacteroidetes bacterium]|nr:MAG: cytochrome c [Bacteroidota bacterium]